ncbi:MAG TPA: RHS repeat-associated core domain-containing protein [Phycisphaerae bacterium]|nr:RHS repeat-associated core domain-containing protein [Phycisphaerae bacterium]
MNRNENNVSGMGRLDMAMKSFVRIALLAAFGLVAMPYTLGAEQSINKTVQPNGIAAPNTCKVCPENGGHGAVCVHGCSCSACEKERGAQKTCDSAGESPDALPSIGDAVELHMVAGNQVLSSQWLGTPNFGQYRYLNWMPMVYLGVGSNSGGGTPIKRDGAQVLFPGLGRAVMLGQNGPGGHTFLVPGGDAVTEIVPAGALLEFSTGMDEWATCTLTYPDGRRWTFQDFGYDLERFPYPDYNGDFHKRFAPRKYRLTKYVDRNGYEVNVSHAPLLTTITDASGNQYKITTDSNKLITKIEVGSRSWGYTYGVNSVTETNNQSGRRTTVTVTADLKHLLTVVDVGADNVTKTESWVYDSTGKLTSHTVDGVVTTVTETDGTATLPAGDVGLAFGLTVSTKTRVMTTGGLTKTGKYAPFGQIEETDGLGKTVKTNRRPTGHVIKTVDQMNRETVAGYNPDGMKTGDTLPNGSQVVLTHDANGNVLTRTTPDGVWHYEYDGLANGYATFTLPGGTVHNLVTREYFVADGQTLSDVSYERYAWTGGEYAQRGLVKYKVEKVLAAGANSERKTWFEYNAAGQVTKRKTWYSDETEPTVYWAYSYDAFGNRTGETNPLGQSTVYTYDSENRLKTVTDALSHTTTYFYDGLGRKTKVMDALGSYTEWHYDSRGFVTSITGSAAMGGGCTSCGQAAGAGDKLGTYVYADSGLLTSYTDLNNHTWTYTYDAAGRKVGEKDPTNYETVYAYYDDGSLHTVTDPNGKVTTYAYDVMGRLLSVTNGAGETTSYTYDWSGRQLTVSGPVSGAVMTTAYDKLGRVLTVEDALTRVTTYAYDMLGRQTLVTAATGTADQVQTSFAYSADDNLLVTVEDVGGLARLTVNEYDAADRLVKTTVDPSGAKLVTAFQYDAAGRLTKSTVDPDDGVGAAELNIETGYTYDAVGRQLTSTTGYLVTSTVYNAAGWVISTSNGVTTTSYEYDEVGNRTKMQVATSVVRSPVYYFYDAANRLVRTEQAAGAGTVAVVRTLDGAGRLLESTDPNGQKTVFTYDDANRVLTVKNAAGEVTQYGYVDAGRVTTVTAPDGGVTETTRDLAGNVLAVKDPLNRTAGYVYDSLNRPVSVTQPDGVVHATVYDKLGRAVTVTEDVGGLNRVTVREYDLAGRLTKATVDPSGLALVTRYEYDAASRRTKTVVDPDNGTGDPEVNLPTTYAYDPLGLVTGTVTGDPAGAHLTVTNTYDVAGRLETTGNGVTTTTLAYDAAGARSGMTVSGRAPVVYTYDLAGRLTGTSQTVGAVTIATTYTLDLGGRVTESADGEGKVTKFVYDGANRVAAETNPAGEVTTFGYDPNGRQTLLALANGSRSVTEYNKAGEVTKTMGGPAGQATYAYDPMGRLLTVTDANGRTRTTVYDHLGRKTGTANEMSQTVGFGYDLAGRWTALTDPRSNVTTWAYDGASRQKTMTYPEVTGQPENVERYFYSAAGLMSRKTTPNGVNVDYTYFANGSVNTVSAPVVGTVTYTLETNGSGAVAGIASGASSMSFTYDQFGRVTGVADSGAGKSLSYGYDKRSLRTSMGGDLPEGLEYTYDDAGRLVTVKKGAAGPSAYAYDAGGRRKTLTLTNGLVTAYSFDGQDRLLSLATTGTAGTVASFGYILDKVGNRQVVQEKDSVLYYRYDQAYRVTGESRVRPADGLLVYEEDFTYDAAGNRLTRRKSELGTIPTAVGPYGLWPLDEVKAKPFTPPAAAFEADGDTAALYHLEESESPMVDSSAAANNGTIAGTVQTEAQGMFTSSCVRIPLATELAAPAVPGRVEAGAVALGAGNWTLEAFVNPELLSGERTVLAQAPWKVAPTETTPGVLGAPAVMLSLADGCPALLVRYLIDRAEGEDEVGEVRLVGKAPVAVNTWQHLAAVRNGLGLYLYVDGECVAIGELPVVSNATISVLSADKLVIGCGNAAGVGVRAAGNFAGRIDEVRLSSIARYTGLVTPEVTANGPDGELLGGASLAESGRFGPALAFDGTGYVKLTGDGDFLKNGAAKRTIEMWVKANSTSGTQMLYEEGGSTSGFALRINAGVLEFTAKDNGGTPETLSTGYTSTGWHKVTAIFNEGAMALYVDGESADVGTAGFTAVSAQTEGAALGGTLDTDAFGGSTTGGSFAGLIDAVRVMNDAVVPATMDVEEASYVYNERNQLTLETTTTAAGVTHEHHAYNQNGENTSIVEHDASEAVLKTVTMTYDDLGRMLTWADGTNTEEHTYRGAGWERASTKVNGGDVTKYLYDGDNVVGDLVSGAFTRQYVTPFLDENLSMTVIGGELAGTYYYSRDGLGSVRTLTDASQVVKNSYAYTAFNGSYSPLTLVSKDLEQRYQAQGREASANAGAPMYFRNRQYSPGLGRFSRRDPVLGGDRLFNEYGFPGENAVGYADPMGLFTYDAASGAKADKAEAFISADFFKAYPDKAKLNALTSLSAEAVINMARNYNILFKAGGNYWRIKGAKERVQKRLINGSWYATYGDMVLTALASGAGGVERELAQLEQDIKDASEKLPEITQEMYNPNWQSNLVFTYPDRCSIVPPFGNVWYNISAKLAAYNNWRYERDHGSWSLGRAIWGVQPVGEIGSAPLDRPWKPQYRYMVAMAPDGKAQQMQSVVSGAQLALGIAAAANVMAIRANYGAWVDSRTPQPLPQSFNRPAGQSMNRQAPPDPGPGGAGGPLSEEDAARYSGKAPEQVTPGTRELTHTRYNPDTREWELSRVYYDQYGRQVARTDWSVHGRPAEHTNPHHHTTEYGPGYAPTGKQSGPLPGLPE